MSVFSTVPPATKPDSPSWMATPNPPSLTGAEFSFEANNTQWGCRGSNQISSLEWEAQRLNMFVFYYYKKFPFLKCKSWLTWDIKLMNLPRSRYQISNCWADLLSCNSTKYHEMLGSSLHFLPHHKRLYDTFINRTKLLIKISMTQIFNHIYN